MFSRFDRLTADLSPRRPNVRTGLTHMVGALSFSLTGILLLSGIGRAELATEPEMANVAGNFVTELVQRTGSWAGQVDPVVGDVHELWYENLLVARYYDMAPRGYVLVPTLREVSPIKAYSDESNLTSNQEGGFIQMIGEILYQQMQLFENAYGSLDATQPATGEQLFDPGNKEKWDRLAVVSRDFRPDPSLSTMAQGGPLLTSSWYQRAPYNNYCPPGDGGLCAVGCVATATAQVMKFWEWPPNGLGNHQYTWQGDNSCGGSTPPQVLFADFSDAYDWANIPDDCNGGCSPAQAAALAELNHEVGVAHNMDYGYCGSGATVPRTAYLLPTFFKYKPTNHVERRREYSRQGWFDIIQQEIDAGRPIHYGIFMHSIVCDGYRDDSGQLELHMNYGWNDGHNAWYILDSLYCLWFTGEILCPYSVESMVAGIEPQYDPVLLFDKVSVSDGTGDGDGLPEPGETVLLNVVITNAGNEASNTTGILSTTDPYVTITGASTAFEPVIPPWGGQGNTQAPFELSIDPSCPDPHVAVLNLALSETGGYGESVSFKIFIGTTPGFEDDVESGDGNWSTHPLTLVYVNDWHLETYRRHSGSTSWKAGGPGSDDYSNIADGALVTPPLLLPQGAKLTFWHWMAAEDDDDFTAWDGGIVMIREGGSEWEQVAPEGGYPYTIIDNKGINGPAIPFAPGTPCYSGRGAGWTEAWFDLSAYSGVVEIMFRFGADGYVTEEGWYIDDVWVGNTLGGTNVQFNPWPGATITFAEVTTRGITTMSVTGTGPEPPSGYAAVPASPPEYCEIETDVAFTGEVQLCLSYDEQDVSRYEGALRLMHHDGTAWVDISTSLETGANQICGTSDSFSPFLIVEDTTWITCCVGRVGDANGDAADEPTISDISTLIGAKFITGSCDGVIACLAEADVNQSGGSDPTCDDITIGDISILIDYLFITGSENATLAECL